MAALSELNNTLDHLYAEYIKKHQKPPSVTQLLSYSKQCCLKNSYKQISIYLKHRTQTSLHNDQQTAITVHLKQRGIKCSGTLKEKHISDTEIDCNHSFQHYYTIRELVILYWHRINVSNLAKTGTFWTVTILPMVILDLISLYIQPFKHEIFLFDVLQINPNRVTFSFSSKFKWHQYVKSKEPSYYRSLDTFTMSTFVPTSYNHNTRKRINNWHQYINVAYQSLQSRVLLDIIISGKQIFDARCTNGQFINVSHPKFELNLSSTNNAFITNEAQQFFVDILTKTIKQNINVYALRLRSTNFDDYMMKVFCDCVQWRIKHNLSIDFEELDFSDNQITDDSFQFFCQILPFMNTLQYISFEWNQLSDKSLIYLMNALNKMIDNQRNGKYIYNLNKMDFTNNTLFSMKSITDFNNFMTVNQSSIDTEFMSAMIAYFENFTVQDTKEWVQPREGILGRF